VSNEVKVNTRGGAEKRGGKLYISSFKELSWL